VKALLAWLPAIALYGFWLLRFSPVVAGLKRRRVEAGSHSHKSAPVASHGCRPA
jgi:hypothetical protein